MLVYRPSGWLRTLFVLLCVCTDVIITERQTNGGKYMTIRREKRSGLSVVEIETRDNEDIQTPLPSTNTFEAAKERIKRDVRSLEETVNDPKVNVSHLNDSHQQVMIQWAGEGSSVIVCLMRNAVQNNDRQSTVFISKDYGTTYQNISSKFEKLNGKLATISTFYKNEVVHSRFVFTDVLNKYVFLTMDYGETIVPHYVRFTPSEVMFHPTDPDVLLIHDVENLLRKLWLTEDFGNTWKLIAYDVKSFFMSTFTSPPTLYIERAEVDKSSVISSQNFSFADNQKTVVIESTLQFEVKDEFIFAVKKSTESDDTLSLLISYRGGSFHKAEFPNNMTHKHYYIADVSEGQVMVCVNHDEILSNLYVSSVPRSPNHPVKFSLSLERIVFFKPSSTWENTWLNEVVDKQFADLHAVAGIPGVFIASQFMPNITLNNTRRYQHIGPEHTVSYISFDQGGQWKRLQPPRKDVFGSLIDCKLSKGCSLHVGQSLSLYYPRNEITPVVSKDSAPGLILATGTIGASFTGHTCLYVSRDAGTSWYQVMAGSFRYAIGDHGGILVAVQHYRMAGEIDTLYYSTDDGESWISYKFSDEKLRIYGLLTEPGENTTIFTLFGSRPEKHQWLFIKVDLRPVFKYECSPSDYKNWSPSDGGRGRACLLGRKQVYERRIPHSNCYSGVAYDPPRSTQNCPCDREDYECDFGFVLDETSQICVKDHHDLIDPYAVPTSCVSGGFYNRTKGYRLIPGDTCEGGQDYQYAPTITACPLREENEFLLVSARQEILRYDLLNPSAGLQPLPIPHLSMVISLDFDLANNCIFWSDVNEKKIFRLCFDGSHDVETLVEKNLRSVEGLAFDWVSKNLYFVDGERKTLEVIRTDINNFGRMRRTLLNKDTLDNPRGIALHPRLGYLYLTDWSETDPKVARAFLDGKQFKTLFGSGEVGWPNGITIDFQDDRIFFADAKLDYIASADLDGKNMRKIISNNEMVTQPFALGIYKSTMFWDDWKVEQVVEADKAFGWGISPIANFTRNGLVDLKVYGHLSQHDTNICVNRSESCAFLCMGRPNDLYSCLCPDGLKENFDGAGGKMKCVCPDGSSADSNGTCKSPDGGCSTGFFKCSNNKCIPNMWVCDEDNDCGDGSDELIPKCRKATCDPSYWQCTNGECIAPLYRCDHNKDCTDGSDEQNCVYEQCANDSFKCANGKCIHKRWKCDMEDDCHDGSDEADCITLPTSQCKSTEFKCAQQEHCIPGSWRCDGDLDCSDRSDETGCEVFSCPSWQFPCKSGRTRCLFRNWHCDGEKDCDDGSDEENCTATTTTTTSTTTPNPDSDCSTKFKCDNGHCIPFWWRCDELDDCGDNSDEEGCSGPLFPFRFTTSAPKTTTSYGCPGDQFQCLSGTCIWNSYVCDGYPDCPGGEDEAHCLESKTCEDLKEFACRRSGGCIQSHLRCNGHDDCADGSDEEGCNDHYTTPSASCPPEHLMCDGGACLPLFNKCDGHNDCIDMSDEKDCSNHSEKIYMVSKYLVRKSNVSLSVSWIVNDLPTPPKNLIFMLSYATKGSDNILVWKNMTWTSNTSYTVNDLSPYTEYVLRMYTKKNNGTKIFPPLRELAVTTKQGIPSPPQDLKIERELDVIKISWKPSATPSGIIKMYHVYVKSSESEPMEQSGLYLEVTIPEADLHDNASVWVTAENDAFVSEPSKSVQFHRASVDHKLRVKSKEVTSSSVTLTWDPLNGSDGYTVSHDNPGNKYLPKRIFTNTSQSSLQVKGLSPGLEYTFKVRPYEGSVLGLVSEIKVTTQGMKLLPVGSLQVVVQEGTTVKLSWTEPSYGAQKVSWTYRIIWGKTSNDLKNATHFTTTSNTTVTIKGLNACEEYKVVIMVEQPLGFGPAVEKQVTTGPDAKAPPKNLKATVKDKNMIMTWKESCHQNSIDNQQYVLRVTETSRNIISYYKLLKKSSSIQSHSVKVHLGGRYSIQVRTAAEGAILSEPVLCNGPAIPPPYELTYNHYNDTFFWTNNPNLPEEITSRNYTYVLYLSKNMNMTDAEEFECNKPSLVVDKLEKGIIYYVTVALKDADGYLSLQSQQLDFEKPIDDELLITQGSAVGVGVSVFLVIVALVVVVGILAVRHRRLARSIIAFTNTHYDTSRGTTLITTDHNLDEDDDSPMIRGFSDDEPLVIA